MKAWKRDLAYIREVGPDEPRFDAAVQRVWERIEELQEEADTKHNDLGIARVRLDKALSALREIAAIGDPVKGTGFSPRAQEIAREALS